MLAGAIAAVPLFSLGAQDTRITPDLLARHIGMLAHDSMLGRATPSRQIEQTAAFVEATFRRAGLAPSGDSGGYQQRFPVSSRGVVIGTGPNVIAVLPGGDPRLASQYVAVVAHMDHVGVGRAEHGDSIYNGADDNASGTAGLLALAEAFAGLPRPPARSLLFIATSGEERGLLGARWYAAHPTVSLDSIVGLVNLDMIGRNRPDSVYLNGWGKSDISDLVRRLAEGRPELGLSVGPDLEDRPVTPADSDHWPFQHRGVPYVFFYTGAHPDYHRVGDEPARADADKASRVTRLAFFTMLELANSPGRPQWVSSSRALNVPASP